MATRRTELRLLTPDQKLKIAMYLEENDCWKRLMSIVPKNLDAIACSCSESTIDWEKMGCKYSNEDISLISTPRQGDGRKRAEIFLEEWSNSGRKQNRPTLGVLLQLLVKVELFAAADYVAEKLLNEPPPPRPEDGPAARFDTKIPSAILNGIISYANNSDHYPNTEDINAIGMVSKGILEKNQDFYTKYRNNDKNFVDIAEAPKPAPRSHRKSERLQKQEQQGQNFLISNKTKTSSPHTKTTTLNGSLNYARAETPTTQQNQEKSTILQRSNSVMEVIETNETHMLPLLSMLEYDSKNEVAYTSVPSFENESNARLPNLSAFNETQNSSDNLPASMPAISALNLDGQNDKDYSENCLEINQQNGSFNNEINEDLNCIDDDDDENDENDENSSKNLEGSNNDSSLTNVTGTSGDSFELSSSSTSNENIPLNCSR